MTRSQRPRHAVSAVTLMALRPFFRHSYSRNAYVPRGVGNRFGPVLVPAHKDTHHPDQTTPAH